MEVAEPFLNYGLLGIVLFSLGVAGYRAASWVGNNAVTPVVRGHVSFLEEATASIKVIRDDMDAIQAIDAELQAAAGVTHETLLDPNSLISTAQTNRALELLSSGVVRVAKKLNVDIEDLHEELRRVLDQQQRG